MATATPSKRSLTERLRNLKPLCACGKILSDSLEVAGLGMFAAFVMMLFGFSKIMLESMWGLELILNRLKWFWLLGRLY